MPSDDSRSGSHIVRFGAFEADLTCGRLSKRGLRLPLREQSFQVLASLLEHPGQMVTRDDLRRRLWRDEVHVDFEKSLNTVVGRLRAVLGDSAERPRFIETLPKRGYRFLARVDVLPARPAESPTSRLRLVVLPFLNLTGDPAQEYLSDALTDEIITALAPLAPDRIAVIARTTSMLYRGTNKDLGQIGRELAVDYAVEGALRRADGLAEMNVQLIRASDQTHVFAKKYETTWPDLFALHARVASDIAAQLGMGPMLLSTGARVAGGHARPASRDLVAYREYMQGRSLDLGTPASFVAAQQHFETAIARDPEFAHAHDALAELYWYRGYLGLMAPRKAFSIGIGHALRALEIDNTRAETHALLGQFHKTIEYNWPEVHREMTLALRLDPNSPVVRTRYAVSDLMPHGRLEEAAAELERALEFDPLSLWAQCWLGLIRLLHHEYERAIEQGRRLLELDPASGLPYFVIGLASWYQKNVGEAIADLQTAVKLTGGVSGPIGWLGLVLAACGRTAEARDLLAQLHARAAQEYVSPASIAWIHFGLRELDPAFEWLNRAVEECDQLVMPIKNYGFLDPIRADPRYAMLLRKMNLEA